MSFVRKRPKRVRIGQSGSMKTLKTRRKKDYEKRIWVVAMARNTWLGYADSDTNISNLNPSGAYCVRYRFEDLQAHQ